MSLGNGNGWITPTRKQMARKLTPGQQKVLDLIRADVGQCLPFPSNKRIAEQCNARPGWVIQVLHSLYDLGYITQARINPKPGKGVQRIEWLLEQGR